jgi:hypothetical protein
MPAGALCDMMESISIASKDYKAVLAGMVRPAQSAVTDTARHH